MKRINELKKVNLDQIPDTYQSLSDGIRQLIADYDQETDKAFFEKEAEANITAYWEMVQSVAPEAAGQDDPPKDKKGTSGKNRKQGKHHQTLLEHHDALLDLSINYEAEESDDLEGFFTNLLNSLNDLLEKSEEKAIPTQVKAASEPFYAQATGLEKNQQIRLGAVEETDVRYRDKAVKIMDELLLALKEPPEKKAPPEKKPMTKSASKSNPSSKSKEQPAPKKAPSKAVQQKVEAYEQHIEECRAVIREHNRKKRADQPAKPKPTRRTLLKKKVLSLVKLTPPAMTNDPTVRAKNRKVVKATIKGFMMNWGMNNIQQVEKSVDQVLDELDDHLQEKEQQGYARQWSKELPDTHQVVAYEKKHNKELLQEAAQEIIDQLKEAIRHYRTDKDKAFDYLQKKFDSNQLESYLPNYILEEMKTQKTNKR